MPKHNCTLCPLHKTTDNVCVLGSGDKPSDIMIIGEQPRRDSEDVFEGRRGSLLAETLEEVGIDLDDVYVTNAVRCTPPDNRTPKKKEIEACRKWLKYEIARVKPKYVLLLGPVALMSALGLKGIKEHRGKPVEKDGITYLPTLSLINVLKMDKSERPVRDTFIHDFKAFKTIIEHGGIPQEKGLNSIIVDTWDKVEQMLDALVGVVSCDIETTGLYPWAADASVVTMGMGTSVGEFSLFIDHRESPWSDKDIRKIMKRIEQKLEECIVVFQNGKFDCTYLLEHYGIRISNDFDTMLAHYLINENARHGLDYLAQLYYGAHDWDIPLKEKQGAAPARKIATYHAHDLFYTRKLYFTLTEELKKDEAIYRVFMKIMMPCARIFVDIETNGCFIDVPKMKDAEKYLNELKDEAEAALKKWGDINWGSPQQVGELLYGKLKIKCPIKTKKGANSTSESALNAIDHPCVSDLLKFRGAKQQLSFFIEGWKPFLHKSRIHPTFKLHGTVTGRLSSERPNFQQVPRDTRIRSLITAPEGWVFLECDLSQIELRIVADLANEPSMLEAFRNNVDIHWLTAMREIERGAALSDLVKETARIATQAKKLPDYGDAIQILLDIGPDEAAEINKEWKEYRKKAKAVNFGYVFGMWWKKFKQYAKDNYGVDLTDKQAEESRKTFFQMYQLERWHEKQRSFAKKYGFVRSLSGRKRRLPDAMSKEDTPQRGEALRQAINSPVQSFANELNLMTLIQLVDEYPPTVVRPVMTVHDQVGMEVRVDKAVEVGERLLEITQGPKLLKTLGIELSVPIAGDVKIGPWGSGVSIDKWKAARRKAA